MTLSTARELFQQAWHALETKEALAKLRTAALGLTSSEAAQRLARFGPNTIQTGEGVKPWAIILHQFTSPLIHILLVVMVITLILQEWADSIVVAAVVLLNAVIGFTQEFRAENSMQALMRMTSAKMCWAPAPWPLPSASTWASPPRICSSSPWPLPWRPYPRACPSP